MQLVLAVLAVLVMTSCGGKSPTAPTVVGVSVTSSATSLIVAETATVRATFLDSVGASAAFTPTWESDNLGVATVTAEGLVTSVGFGTVSITARHPDGRQGSIKIGVFPEMRAVWNLTMVRVSCIKVEIGSAGFGSCAAESGTPFSQTLTIGSQTPSSDDMMTVTGLYITDFVEGTVNTAGQLSWSTLPDSESIGEDWDVGIGTHTHSREGVFQVATSGENLSGEYSSVSQYHGFADAIIDVTYTYVYRILSSYSGY
jgi:hypothetical protein